jgi:hypothetical protein
MMNRVIGVVAPKGSGKSHEVTKRVFAPTPCVAIYDPQADRDSDYRMAASHIVDRDLKEARKVLAEENFQLLFRPDDPIQDGDEWRFEDFGPFLMMCFRRCELIGPMTLVVDEAHFTCSKRTMPYELMKITAMSRAVGLNVIWVTQKFSGVNTWLRSNADEYWIFRLASPGDLDIVNQVCGSEVEERIVQLRRLDDSSGQLIPGEMLIWSSLDNTVRIIDLAATEDERDTGQRYAVRDDSGPSGEEVPNKATPAPRAASGQPHSGSGTE